MDMKAFKVYFLCIVCQLNGKVMHTPVKLLFAGTRFSALLKKVATPIKIACALLKIGVIAAKVAGVGCSMLPSPDISPFSIEKHTEMAEIFE
jgi:hypothetical protein